MRKKLLFFSLMPLVGFAQAQMEISAKQLAAQAVQPEPVVAQALLDCAPASLPYSENFNSVTVPAIPECSTIENAGTGNDFTTAGTPGYGFSSNVLRYKWHTSSPANAWWFTPGFEMTAGTTYNLSFKYGSAGATAFTEKLKVHVGTDAQSAAMNAVPLIDHPVVNNNVTPITDNLEFTPEADGIYYFGFNCYSLADQFYLFIDDISVSENLSVSEQTAVGIRYFPNPVIDRLTVSGVQEIDFVEVYNQLGQMVMKQVSGSATVQINMEGLPRGTYLVKVGSGSATEVRKVMKI